MSENELKKINPKVCEVEIGIRALRKIKIYPLSLADETELLDLVKVAFEELVKVGSLSDQAEHELAGFASFLVDLFVVNVGKVLEKVIDDFSTDLLKEIDNDQLLDILSVIVKVNFEGVLKKASRLLGGEGVEPSALWRRLLRSSPDIPNTDSNTFSNIPIEKEGLPEDN